MKVGFESQWWDRKPADCRYAVKRRHETSKCGFDRVSVDAPTALPIERPICSQFSLVRIEVGDLQKKVIVAGMFLLGTHQKFN